MAESLLVGAAVGAAVAHAYEKLLKKAISPSSKVLFFKKHMDKLTKDLTTFNPYFSEIFKHITECHTAAPTVAREWEQHVLAFKDKLDHGNSLIEQCQTLRGFHPIQQWRLSNSILRLRREIRDYLKLLPTIVGLCQTQFPPSAILAKADEEDKEEVHKLQETIVNPLKETMMSLVKEGAEQNASILMDAIRQLQENNSTGSSHSQQKWSPSKSIPLLPDYVVGLENPIAQVKSLLFASGEDKLVAIVGGMGGIGKTTLALALCRDPQVTDYFREGIHFITVSQCPNMTGLLSTIWSKVTGQEAPPFQNLEDAFVQLQSKLSSYMQQCSSKCLLVLDDVWSKADLEKLTLHVKGFRTLVTTRQAAMLETSKSQTYTLGLLSEENACTLLCHWTFGKQTIPSWADETLVKEVISECKGLPLALKVIGGSLFSEAHIDQAWRRTRDKLRQAEPLGEDQQKLLYRRLQTSVDALDQELRDCFMDLGAFPEDSQCSVDNLLDIWVYVRGMDWDYAYLALIELASRCLLNFGIQRFGEAQDHTTEYGCAGSLVFSQHDVMRDLAIQLSRETVPIQKSRWLLMPQRQEQLPLKWQSVNSFAAQVISISTGSMLETDWPALDFPCTEALLLYSDGAEFELPPFMSTMSMLKVLVVRHASNGGLKMGGCLRVLNRLHSMDIMSEKLLIDDQLGHVVDDYSMPKLRKLQLRSLVDGFSLLLGSHSIPSLEIIKFDCFVRLKEFPSKQHFRSLRVLCLQGCPNLKELPENLGTFSMLNCISLWYCHYLEELPTSICQLKKLEVLQLFECIRLTKLPTNLGDCIALKKLLISGCKKLSHLPDTLVELQNLKLLDLKSSYSLKRLPGNIWQVPSLKTLNMSYCLSLEVLPDNFGFFSSIRELSLTYSSVLKHLPNNFGCNLQNLSILCLKGCYELRALPEGIGQCYQLEQLDLSRCSELTNLTDNVTKLVCLDTLDLSGCNNLTNLPLNIGNLKCLRELNLSGTIQLETLPESFGELTRLEVLNLSDCQKLTELPSNIGQLQCLKQLDLSYAVSLMTLPESFGELTGLENLKLEGLNLKQYPANFGCLINELKRWNFIGKDS